MHATGTERFYRCCTLHAVPSRMGLRFTARRNEIHTMLAAARCLSARPHPSAKNRESVEATDMHLEILRS